MSPPAAGGHDPEMELDVAESQERDLPLSRMLNWLDKGQSDDVRRADLEIMNVIRSLGGSTSKYRRERSKALRAVVSEIYSPPRVSAVAKMCPSYGVLPGFALDLTTHDDDGRHWDFDEEEMRTRAWKKIEKEQPLLLIGCLLYTSPSPRD